MGAFGWIQDNFTVLLNSVGIIGGLLFTACSFRAESHVRRLGNLISLTQSHREIWFKLYEEPSLSRILDPEIDLAKNPPTLKEEVFVTALILHLNCIHRAASLNLFPDLEGLRTDVREFYSLPIPRTIWGRWKPLQDLKFITFVEGSLSRSKPRA